MKKIKIKNTIKIKKFSHYKSAKFKQLKGKILIVLVMQIVKCLCNWWLFAHVDHEVTNKP
jgi:hypothetical protein